MMDRLPALPLIANDPYFSIWVPGDTLTEATPIHWSGAPKPVYGHITIDGRIYRWLSRMSQAAMPTVSLQVTPTQTISMMETDGVRLEVRFWSPALPDDWDSLSTPVTFADLRLSSIDGKVHQVKITLNASEKLCFDGEMTPQLSYTAYELDQLHAAWIGQAQQKPLCHSGDHITIDWGYLYMASQSGQVQANEGGLHFVLEESVGAKPVAASVLLGYDDIASINYFGAPCRAWYMRDGKTLPQALCEFSLRHDELMQKCTELDSAVMDEAESIGGEDYRLIACAAWRHTLAAHKLIATPEGQAAFLSKENDSNGCIGTVDLSYPSCPMFLKYCPELVNALCLPVLQFASMPVWEWDFAPHDVGRYPYATGQVYAARKRCPNGHVHPPYYLYPAGTDCYDFRYQMPVEECGNMLILLEAGMAFGASEGLSAQYLSILEKWAGYLDRYGEDPGDQLCTDDFAGHLSHNVNLSAKAMVGLACFGRILRRMGRKEEAAHWENRAQEMAQSWLKRAKGEGGTALTFDGRGWSMKYNLVWDRVLGLNLLPDAFYEEETDSYLSHINEFGLPLDSRADYTKSDWILWVASMAKEDTFRSLTAPMAHYLRTTTTRVPFSDWYDTKTGRFVAFIGRSVQGGLYMPMIAREKENERGNQHEKNHDQ